MKVPSKQKACKQVAERLAELVGVDMNKIRFRKSRVAFHTDNIVKVGAFTFALQWKLSGAVGSVASAIDQMPHDSSKTDGTIIPLIAVPFMAEAGRKRCEEADVSWLDLSGNARIIAPGLRILIEGKPNRYKRSGRPSTVFAPKSSRIARWLLMHPGEPMTQREMAKATHTDEGYTSKVVGKLEDDGLIVRDGNGAIKPSDPDLLLDAWREVYDFSKHQIVRGHIPARAGDVLLKEIAKTLKKASMRYAATGLGAAWMLDRFAGFRTTTLYLAEEPSPELFKSLHFREDERGANVWLVIPNDEGVFHGAMEIIGIRCVHPVQIYLDLQSHPERAEEASQNLRASHLNWRTDA